MNKVILTKHCVDSYQERVKPALDYDRANRDLGAMVAQGELAAQCGWHRHPGKEVAAYLLIADGVALVLEQRSDSRWTAVTCIVRGGLSEAGRERRRRKRRARRTRKRTTSDHQLERHQARWDARRSTKPRERVA